MSVAEALPATDEQPVVILLQQGIALYRMGDMAGAEDVFTRVLLVDPGNPHALHILGLVCLKRGDREMAEGLLDRSVRLAPHSRVLLNLGVVRQQRGDLDGAISAYREAIEREPGYPEGWANLLFALDMHPQATPDLLRAERAAFDSSVCAPLTALAPPHTNDRDPDRRLRVGYVSADFRTTHSASMAFGWIADHDPAAVEVYLYSTYPGAIPEDSPFRARADVWSEVADLAPHELAGAIREDRIDILVDLGGVAEGGRPLTVALRPAPVQIGGWGYPHGLGIRALDYLVADPVAIPPEHADRYAERRLPLPSILGYRSWEPLPDVGEAPAARRGYRTYGYLGRAMKLDAETLGTWAAILRDDPTGRLLLKSPQYADRAMRERVVGTLTALGVSPERIEVRERLTSRREHLLAHRDVDVALDPLGIGGGITTLDATAMGVPTVATLGEAVSGRISASILTAIGARAWITRGRREYVELARLGHVPNRRWLRDLLLGSVLTDGPGYARAVEDAYRDCWRRWCREAA